MSYEKEFKEFLNRDGNGYLSFLEQYAVMDDRKLLDREGYLYNQVQQHSMLALYFIGEYEKANYAKYLHSLKFDVGEFTYTECIEADIYGLFKDFSERIQKRARHDYNRLLLYMKDRNKRHLRNNVFIG